MDNKGSAESGFQPQFEIPTPQAPESSPENTGKQPEATPSRPEVARPSSAAPVATPAVDPASLAQPTASQAVSVPSAPPVQTVTATSAKDVDLIEKQWVEKAKAIVTQTREDPYVQKREISKVKADYIQKRFSKNIKIEDGNKQ